MPSVAGDIVAVDKAQVKALGSRVEHVAVLAGAGVDLA